SQLGDGAVARQLGRTAPFHAGLRDSGFPARSKTMTDLRNARLLARYRTWADQLTFDAVAALPPGEATKERPTLFKTMIGTLNHTYVIDLIWQAHLEGRDHGFTARNLVLHEGLPELWRAQQAVNQWYIDWSERQSGQSLDEIVRFQFIGGAHGAMTRGDIL